MAADPEEVDVEMKREDPDDDIIAASKSPPATTSPAAATISGLHSGAESGAEGGARNQGSPADVGVSPPDTGISATDEGVTPADQDVSPARSPCGSVSGRRLVDSGLADERDLARLGLKDLCDVALEKGLPLQKVNACGTKNELLQLIHPEPKGAPGPAGGAMAAAESVRPPWGSIAALLCTTFVDFLGLFIALPILPFLVLELGGTVDDIGYIMACYSASQLLSMLWMPPASDKIGRRPMVILSNLGSFAGYLLVGLAANTGQLYAFRIVGGAFAGTMGVAQAYLADIVPRPMLPQYQGYMTGSLFLGIAFGPSIGGAVSVFGNNVPFFVAAALAAVSLLNSIFLLKPPPKPATPPNPTPAVTDGGKPAEKLPEPKVPFCVYVIAFCRFWLMFSVRGQGSVLAVQLQESRGWGGLQVSFLYIGLAVLQIGFQALGYRKTFQKLSLAGVSVAGCAVGATFAWGIYHTAKWNSKGGTVVFILFYEAFMVGGVVALLPLSALAVLTAPAAKRGFVSSVDMSAGAAGQVVGSLAGPAIWKNNPFWAFGLCGFAQMVAGVLAALLCWYYKETAGLGKQAKAQDARMSAFDQGEYDYKEEKRFLDEMRHFLGDLIQQRNYFPGHPDKGMRTVIQSALKLMVSDALPAWAPWGTPERLQQREHLLDRMPHVSHAIQRMKAGEDPGQVLHTYIT
eukprot:TRINITY_DN18490_c0_g1_i1.p1 TRINITY_DN18490_c0_g1~~TRINITY_DN18490_c0_g1_i1.p1  ORF type:complete len:712 (+),score=231.42 TRINITY_DN18490_c0_g1_i1:78-2138(+)